MISRASHLSPEHGGVVGQLTLSRFLYSYQLPTVSLSPFKLGIRVTKPWVLWRRESSLCPMWWCAFHCTPGAGCWPAGFLTGECDGRCCDAVWTGGGTGGLRHLSSNPICSLHWCSHEYCISHCNGAHAGGGLQQTAAGAAGLQRSVCPIQSFARVGKSHPFAQQIPSGALLWLWQKSEFAKSPRGSFVWGDANLRWLDHLEHPGGAPFRLRQP